MGHRLADEADFIGAASVQGKLFDFGKWPGLALSNSPFDRVFGEAWRLRSAASLEWLDAYEGIGPHIARPEYERIRHNVLVARYGIVPASIYLYRWPIEHSRQIHSGSWTERAVVPRGHPQAMMMAAAPH